MISLLPNENIIYLGDTARVPYGSKSADTVVKFSIQISRFLLEQKVKLIVVACNTASSLALEPLQKLSPVPVIGVVAAGVRTAAELCKNGKSAVIGTAATINSGAYPAAMKKINSHIKMFAKACPLFVPLVEEGWGEHSAAELIAEEYLKEIKKSNVDSLILGCTHYPLLETLISRVAGPEIKIINPAKAVAKEVQKICSENSCANLSDQGGIHQFYVTDLPEKFHELSKRFLGCELKNVKKISVERLEEYLN